MTARNCLACQRPITGRIDKKFCTDSCRTSYHNYNRFNGDAIPVIRTINNILRKNRLILQELLKSWGKTAMVTDKQYLVDQGFHFSYFTEQYRNDKSEVYFYCYDYGYRKLEDGRIMAVKDTRSKRTVKSQASLLKRSG